MKFMSPKSLVLRYKRDIILMGSIGIALSIFISLFFPGEVTMQAMFDFIYDSALSGVFPAIDGDAPGWGFSCGKDCPCHDNNPGYHRAGRASL